MRNCGQQRSISTAIIVRSRNSLHPQGGCTCVEVHDPKTLEGFQQFAYERGVFCRPFLNYMYSMVPYVISDGELIQIFDVMKDWFH